MQKIKLPNSGEEVEFKLGDISDRKTEITVKFPASTPIRLKNQFMGFLKQECGHSYSFKASKGIWYHITLTADQNKVGKIMNKAFEVLDNELVQLKRKQKDALETIIGKSEDENKSKFINNSFWFDVALSFAGEDRKIAERIAQELKKRNVSLFYAGFEQNKLWGKRLSKYFQQVYGPKTRFVVVLISEKYSLKDWTDFEFDIARKEARLRKEEFILPVRIDDTPIPGLHRDVVYLDP